MRSPQMPHVKVNPLWQRDQHPNCLMLYDKREAHDSNLGLMTNRATPESEMGPTPSLTPKFLRPVSYLHCLGPSLSWSYPLETKGFASRKLPTMWPLCHYPPRSRYPPSYDPRGEFISSMLHKADLQWLYFPTPLSRGLLARLNPLCLLDASRG